MSECRDDIHRGGLDRFSQLHGVHRSVPGDMVCLDCGELLPYQWNGGKPVPAEEGLPEFEKLTA